LDIARSVEVPMPNELAFCTGAMTGFADPEPAR